MFLPSYHVVLFSIFISLPPANLHSAFLYFYILNIFINKNRNSDSKSLFDSIKTNTLPEIHGPTGCGARIPRQHRTIHFRNEIQNMSEKGAFYEKLKSLRRESDRVLFSDGGKHWPIFRVKDDLYNDFWPFFERYIKEWTP